MFEKLDILFDGTEIEQFKHPYHTAAYGKRFIEYPVTDKAQLMQVINKKINFDIYPTTVLFTEILGPGAPAHCDRWKTAMNIYLSSGVDDVTNFYTVDDSGTKIREVVIFDYKNLTLDKSFIANKGECFLLNTHVPHDVDMKETGSKRLILRFTWENYSFQEIKDSIKIVQG